MKERQFNPPQGSFDSTASLTLSSVGSERTYFAPSNWRIGNISIATNFWADTEKPLLTVESKLKFSQVKT